MFTSILEPSHLIVILIVALLFLGPKRLPGAGRALGQGLREFKHSISGVEPNDDLIETHVASTDENGSRPANAPPLV
jgi:sec-independent protein translocase protein TatA